jgi:tetratricopeptide (TPR) repeat protein
LYYETLLPYFDFGWAGLRGVRTDDLKYISAPEPELYETGKDPKEEMNRYAEMEAAAQRLDRSLMKIAADLAAAAARAGGREVDAAEREKLEALGYASGALHTSIEGDPFKGPDPKSRIWVENALNSASRLFAKGRYTEALEQLGDLHRQEPRNPNVLYFLAVVNAEMGRLSEAVELYLKLIEVQPLHDKAWNNLGVLYNQRGMPDEALAAFERSLEQDEQRADVHYNMASIYGERGEVEKAERALKRAVEIQPTFAKAFNNLGTLYASLGKYEDAVGAFLKALAVDPRLGLSHKNCARCYYLLKDYKKAARHLEQALKLGVEVDPELVRDLNPYR